MDAKSPSREEHVERVDSWKKVERFMAGCSATEMPRLGVRQRRAWRGMASLNSGNKVLFATAYSHELVRIDNFKAGFFAFDKFVTSCRTTYCAIV